jgi:hypothetical protein
VRPEPVAPRRFGQRRAYQRRADAVPASLRVYHQLGHARFLITRWRQIEVAGDGLAGRRHDQMIGAVMG